MSGNGLRRGKFLRRAGLVILMGACAMLLSASQAKAVLIDHFIDGDFTLAVAFNGAAASAQQTGSMLGGYRDVTLIADGGSSQSEHAIVNQNPAIGYPSHLSWSEDDSIYGRLILKYDANGGGLNSEFTDGGASTQLLVGYETDGHRVDLTVEVVTGLGTTGQQTATASVTIPASPIGGTAVIPFSAFVANNALINLTDLDRITYTFNSSQAVGYGGDYYFDLLGSGTVPEPVTMLGMFLGLGSVGAYIRKRRMA